MQETGQREQTVTYGATGGNATLDVWKRAFGDGFGPPPRATSRFEIRPGEAESDRGQIMRRFGV